jgi:multiple sugar transport system permease protein
LSASFSTLLALLLGIPAAYALSRWAERGKHALSFAILVTRMAPPIAFTIPFFLFYRWIGLLDTVTGLVLIYTSFNLPLVIWMMQPFFETVPPSLEEAALVDGASTRTIFLKIVLPMVAPGIAATAILCFLYAWNDFFFALILTRTNARTAPVAVVNFMNYEGWEWGKIAAGGSLVMAPVLIFSLAVRRYLVSGLAAGAVKG